MAGRSVDVLGLTGAEKSELTTMASRRRRRRHGPTARIVLTCADGLENKAVAAYSRCIP